MRVLGLYITLTIIVAAALSAVAEPKAYELVRYRGKAGGMTIAFDFADGYPQGSELRITKAGSRVTMRFDGDQGGEMRFVPMKNAGGTREVILKISPDDAAPESLDGVYRAAGKTTPFKLKKL